MRPRGAALCAALSLVTPSVAAQQTVRWVAFSWVRGEGADACPTQPAVMSAVRARINRDAFSATAPTAAEAMVERVEGRWRASLRIRDAEGAVLLRRAFDDASPSCDAVVDAVAVSLSLALTPGDPTPAPPDPERPPVLRVTPPQAPLAVPERARLTLGVEASWGALPTPPAWGASMRAEALLHPRWSAWIAATFEPESTLDDRYAFGMTRGALGACWRALRVGRVELAACVGASAGAVHAVTFRLAPVDPGNYLWIAAMAEGRALLRVAPHVFVEVNAAAFGVALPNAFTAGAATVYAQERVAAAVTAALGASL